jgi:uroporphyrinogen decarboxylase
MPYDTPIENTIAIMDALHHPESYKQMLANYTKSELGIDIQLPDYQLLAKPLIEVFTIDSTACAACGYLKEATMRLKNIFDDKIDVVEYKSTKIENVARVKKLGVRNLPSIYVNGKLYASSIIPNHDKFVQYIKTLI